MPEPVPEPVPNLAAGAATRLRLLENKLVNRRPVKAGQLKFRLKWLASSKCLQKIDAKLKSKLGRNARIIYRFTATDKYAYKLLADAFLNKDKNNNSGQNLNYCRLMNPDLPKALYVGSSTNFRSRIGQHLGRIGGAGTYSMRLALWAAAVPATIVLDYWEYDLDIGANELEVLEQELWDACTPLLGKRSGR